MVPARRFRDPDPELGILGVDSNEGAARASTGSWSCSSAQALRNRYWYRDGCPAGHGGCRDEMGAHNQGNPDDPAYSSLPAPTSGVTPVTRASENSWVRDTRHLVGLLESELLRYLPDTSGYLRYHGVLTGGFLSRCLQRSLPPGQGSLLQQQAATR